MLALAAPAKADDVPSVGIRGGLHPTFTRLVFDWERAVEVEVTERDGGALITFSAPARFDLGPLKGRTIDPIRGVDPVSDRSIKVTLNPPATHRVVRDGTKVAIDFMLKADPMPARPAPAKPASTKPTPATPMPSGPASARPPPDPASIRPASDKPAAAKAPAKAPAASGLHAGQPTPLPGTPAAANEALPSAGPAMASLAAEAAAQPSAAPIQAVPLIVGAEALPGGGLRLRFPWKHPVGAAVYDRGGRFWIVFSRPAVLDLSGLGAGNGGLVAAARQVPQGDAAVLTLRLRSPMLPVVAERDNVWTVDLKDPKDAAMPIPLGIVAEPRHPAGPRVTVATAGASPVLRLRDPEVGDQLAVVPIAKVPAGISIARDYPEFSLVPTVQGIAIKSKADGVTVEVTADAVAILASQGLAISGANAVRDVPAIAAGNPKAPMKADPMRFAAWAGPPGNYLATRHGLLQALVTARPSQVGTARVALARFHLANGEEAEALGILAQAGTADTRLADEAQFRLLRAAALTELRRYAEAEAELVRPDLVSDPEAMLWRGLAAEGMGDHAKAADLIKRGENVLILYPPIRQALFRFALADANLALGNLASAKAALDLIDPELTTPDQRVGLMFRRAEIDLRGGDRVAARPKLEEVAASEHRQLATRARFALIGEKLAAGQIDRQAAIEEMDRLRLAWRGDAFEPTLLRRIGSLMVEGGQWREGFAAWRQASTLFAGTPYARQIADDLAAAFERLYLGGGADQLSPVEALGIYYDFRELTPAGAKGDEMIRRLADRLAAVDLLEQAGDLIEHQVNFRLKGEERARLANRLAILRLLDRQPERALKALDSTAGLPLPADLMLERRLVEARALGELGRFDQARQVLANDNVPPADAVRMELAWRSKDWPEAARLAGQTAEAALQASPAGDEATRRQILQGATALTLAGDEAALINLRNRLGPLFDGKPEADAFLLLTSRVDRTDKGFQELTREIAGVGQIEAFLAAYRDRIKSGQLSAIN
jgi:hypothetical protein